LRLQFCWGIGYVTASIFFAVAEMALDTTLMSLCMDSEEHNGTALFAPHSLVETLNTFVERQEAAEAERDFKRHGRFEDQSQSDRDSSDDRSDDDS
jgi:hypothetical protein